MKLRNDHILIFGGARGIGIGIAKKLLAEGTTITIAGRNTEKLKQAIAEMASDKAHYITADITHLAEHDAFLKLRKRKSPSSRSLPLFWEAVWGISATRWT